MSSKLLGKLTESYRNLSLQNIITFPFLLQIFVTVGLVGYLSWRNGEQAVNNVTSKLRSEVTTGVEQHLKGYLQTPHLIVQLKQNSVGNKQLNVADFPSTQRDFWSTIRLFDSVRAIYVGNETGKFIYTKREQNRFYSQEVIDTPLRKTYILDSRGQKQGLVETNEYDPRIRPWYVNTLRTQKNNWSKIYTFTGGELGITAAGLLEDRQGDIQGIVGVDLILSGIGRFLRSIEISKNGQVFVLERNGYLVATSTDEAPFIYNPVTKKEQRLRAIASQNSLVRATTKHITEHFSSLYHVNRLQQLEFKLNQQNQLVQVVPYQDKFGLDWLIVVVLPEADFMAEIESNTRNTILLCFLALAIATILGIYTSRKIAQPIANLSRVTNIIARSAKERNTSTSFCPLVQAKNIKELQLLAESFNEMAVQLKAAFRDLENSNQTLEKRVAQRTKDLIVAKEVAEIANRTKSEFLANMSHELRTPLHAILGFTQVALQDTSLKFQQQENLLTVKNSGEHLLSLIDGILEMSNLEAGSLSLNLKPCDLDLLLNSLSKMFELRSEAQPLSDSVPSSNPGSGCSPSNWGWSQSTMSLTIERSPELPQYIETDPVKLKQTLINLIENSIKFTQQGDVTLNLQLVTEANEQKIAFAISDSGHGITPSELDSIFVPFTCSKYSIREGTGLGLAISQQYVRLLGGEIIVSSQLGQGSIYEFQIPLKIVEPPESSAVEHPPHNIALQTPQTLSVPTPAINLSELANMPTEWLEQLGEAAIAVDGDLILRSISQIPSAQINLAQGLTRMLKNFEYDEMLALVNAELGNRKL
ncbi:histidine kinase [Pleurocapsales cyanobacterium LEGE 10410]|nr:histidine kinase [Pleurocapsales cyanobacterium LEGE 10410]